MIIVHVLNSMLSMFAIASYQTSTNDRYFLRIWGGAIQDVRNNAAYQQPIKLLLMSMTILKFTDVCRIISRLGLTQDIKIGSCVFQCDVPHQWIAQPRVGHVSVYCDRMTWHPCVAAHWSKYHYYKQAPSRYDLGCLSDVKPQENTATGRHRLDTSSDVLKGTLNSKKHNVYRTFIYETLSTIRAVPTSQRKHWRHKLKFCKM